MTQDSIRVLIADDHPVVRSGLARMIDFGEGMSAVAEAENGTQAIELFHQHQPDVVLMDLRMPEINGVDAIIAIRQEFPHARIIILTTYDTDEDIFRGLQAGASGYLLKDAKMNVLLDAIRQVHAGKNYIPPEVGAKLATRLSSPKLSDRELEVLQHIAQGKNNSDIATVLGISEGTIKFHITNIFSKLGVSDRTQAVLVAIKRGLVTL